MATTKIDDYQVMYSANTFPPRIILVNSGNFIGQLIFYPNGADLPPDGENDGQVNLNYHLDDFENCVALLGNGKSVFLLFNGSGPENENGLQTAQTIPSTKRRSLVASQEREAPASRPDRARSRSGADRAHPGAGN